MSFLSVETDGGDFFVLYVDNRALESVCNLDEIPKLPMLAR